MGARAREKSVFGLSFQNPAGVRVEPARTLNAPSARSIMASAV